MSQSDNFSQAPRGLWSAARYEFHCKELPGPRWHVRRFTLVEALSEPYRLTVELLTDEAEVDVAALLGGSCQLRIDRDTTARVVHGIIERVVELGAVADRQAFQLDVVPAFGLRAQAVDTRFFQEMSVPEIVEAVLSAPLAALGRKLRMDIDAGDYQKREYCVQYRESDHEFVARLLQEEGIVYAFDHPPDGDAELLVLLDDTARCPKLELADGGDEVLYVDKGLGTARRESVDSLTPTHALRSTAIVQRDFDWKKPSESPYEHERRTKEPEGGEREVYHHNDRRLFSDDGATRAKHKLDQRTMQTRVFHGTGDVVEFMPGRVYALLGHPQHALDRDHLLIRVRHRGEAPEEDLFAQEAAARGARYSNEFDCIENDVPWRPEPLFSKPRAFGLQTAIVTGPESEEIHTDEHGRIKVRFHWDRVSPFDDTSSCWIRVSQRWGGPGWGAMILPRIGMEVLVEFLDGDPDRPIVTGCVYNGDNRPPYPLPDDKTKSTLKSDSSPGGGGFNELRFEDAKGHEEIYIHAQLDMKTEVIRDAARQVGRDDGGQVGRHQTHSVGVDRTASVGNNENLSVGVDQSLSVGSNQTINVGSNQTTGVGSNQTLTVGSNQTNTIGANQTSSVGANQSTSVGANQSLQVGASQTVSVGANMSVSGGGSQSITLGGACTMQAGGALTVGIGGATGLTFSAAHTLDVGAARTTTIGGGDTLNVAGALTITAASITLTAGGSKVEITPGGINITSAGLISVTGATVNVNS